MFLKEKTSSGISVVGSVGKSGLVENSNLMQLRRRVDSSISIVETNRLIDFGSLPVISQLSHPLLAVVQSDCSKNLSNFVAQINSGRPMRQILDLHSRFTVTFNN